ncbi:phosphoribosyltransferase family protein [Citromicrobium bathyomarinum]|uniref:ComF family protein n=1 Tax=Citromicrobium bathyomarinum TaxID=72174 RepID=UPI00315AF6AF
MYNESARQLVLRFKHGRRIGLAKLMGRLMAGRLAAAPANALLVPVPLHRTRLWARGFNQAALLARAVAGHTGHAVAVDALKRTRSTPMLGGLGRAERARMMRASIVTSRKGAAAVQGRDVILVDDVLTSGATSAACTRALLDAGARSVRIACFARVREGVREGRVLERETPGTSTIPGAA